MDKTQRIIIVLLILAMVFSAVSIYIGFSALNIRLPNASRGGSGGENSGFGGVSLVVEGNNAPSGGNR